MFKNISMKTKKRGRVWLGLFFILLGINGGFLPIIQGWVFILIGITLIFGPKTFKFLKKKVRK